MGHEIQGGYPEVEDGLLYLSKQGEVDSIYETFGWTARYTLARYKSAR